MYSNQLITEINRHINEELASPSHFHIPNPYTRRQRAGLSTQQFEFDQLHSSLLAEKSPKDQVALAYKLILNRTADEDGCILHLETLKNEGITALIARLRYSPEGRQTKTPIKGLMAPYIKYRLRTWLIKPSR